jgi:hypothetical protein
MEREAAGSGEVYDLPRPPWVHNMPRARVKARKFANGPPAAGGNASVRVVIRAGGLNLEKPGTCSMQFDAAP